VPQSIEQPRTRRRQRIAAAPSEGAAHEGFHDASINESVERLTIVDVS
jgi:AcrR family transcriptional regulator